MAITPTVVLVIAAVVPIPMATTPKGAIGAQEERVRLQEALITIPTLMVATTIKIPMVQPITMILVDKVTIPLPPATQECHPSSCYLSPTTS